MSRKIKLAAACFCAAGAGLTAVAQAATPELEPVDIPDERVERAMDAHRESVRYRQVLDRAREYDAEPKNTVLEQKSVTLKEIERGTEELSARVEKAKKQKRIESQFGLAGGVSQATLDAIAACESGGDPTAVNAAGYYGKYQFDTGTWASVGGSGNPAAASEAEQDYRASLLYARAGSSPWPVCGQ